MLKNIIKRMLLVSCVCVFSLQGGERTVEELIKEGDELASEFKTINPAANRYWQAAAKGSLVALEKLSELYADYDKVNSWDSNDTKHYVQLAADQHYKKEDAVFVPVDLVIIADEDKIIKDAVDQLTYLKFEHERDGIYFNKFKDWGWARRHRAAITIEQLKKNILIDGKNGRFICRSRKFKSGKIVALVDTKTAKENFDFYKSNAEDGEIYLRGFPNQNQLVPLRDVLEYSITSEVEAFSGIVQKLGAKRLRVIHLSSSNNEKDDEVVISSDGNSVSGKSESQIRKKIESLSERSWRGNTNPLKFDNPWFERKPEWKIMYDMRHNSFNPIKSYKIEWRCQNQIAISNKIHATFEQSKYSGKLSVMTKIEKEWAYSIDVIFEE